MENYDESINVLQKPYKNIEVNSTESESEQTQTQHRTQIINNLESNIQTLTEQSDEKTVSMHSHQSEYVTIKQILLKCYKDKIESEKIFDATIENLRDRIENLTIQNKEKDEEILKYEKSQKTLYETVNDLQNYIRKLNTQNEDTVKKWSNSENQVRTINELQKAMNEKNVLITKYEELISRLSKKRNDKVDCQQKKSVKPKTFLENKENIGIPLIAKSIK